MTRLPWLRLILLWLAGIDLRVTLLAIPPLLPLIHRHIHLNETAVAALIGLPVLLLAAGATVGSMLIGRLDARRVIIFGLFAIGVTSASRAAGPSAAMLFGMTFLMGAGIAIIQPAFPAMVYHWAPHHPGLATAVYTNGLIVGEVVSAALTTQLVVPLVGGWQSALIFWSFFPILTAVLLLWLTPPLGVTAGLGGSRWWPDFKGGLTWRLGLMQGGTSIIYFGANAFFPDYLHSAGAGAMIAPSLAWLSAGQLPASIVVALFPRAFVGKGWPVQIAAVLTAASLAVFLIPHPWARGLGAALLGFTSAFAFVLALAFPPLLAADSNEVHRISAGMFTIAYSLAFILPLIGGAAWDRTGIAATSLIPMAVGSLCLLLGPIGIVSPRHDAAAQSIAHTSN
jgi:CP family cyanate transporter-like MFS transporter